MNTQPISDHEFSQFQRFIRDAAGISMSSAKKPLVSGRLAKRLQQHRFTTYGDYFRLLASGTAPDEVQTAVDLLTTNETYFFREPKHFELLRDHALATRQHTHNFRVWSAACSSGEEVYSIAMVLADCLGNAAWEILGSDISSRVLRRARTGHYPEERAKHVSAQYLRRFCLKGNAEHAGTLLVERSLRNRVQFMQVNLNAALPQLGFFDMIFLRNVMIYFNGDTKRQVVGRVLSLLKPGGFLCIGHSESLHDMGAMVEQVAPAIYRKGLKQ